MDESYMAEDARMDSSLRIKATSALYKKSIKPLIEKKRRARINASLDQLKGLLQDEEGQQNQHVSKLEKADLLELTVKHLKRLKRSGSSNPVKDFSAGYIHCQSTVSNYLSTVNTLDPQLQSQLLQQLDPTKPKLFPDEPALLMVNDRKLPAAQIWKPLNVITSPHQMKVTGGYTNMDSGSLSPEQCVPSPMWMKPPFTFQTALPLPRSTSMACPSTACNGGTRYLPPDFVTSESLSACADLNKHYPHNEGAPHPSYPALHVSEPSSTVGGFTCSLGYHVESPVLQDYCSSPYQLPQAALASPPARSAPVEVPEVWRPW
ncbi:transcription factor HES-1-like [Ambystoma mexicanum]|uniref:transcription factor HES-1-like n=1 Tax=Ambystoma mexicanum TaxID=8296 RepID=UPI0037E87EAB